MCEDCPFKTGFDSELDCRFHHSWSQKPREILKGLLEEVICE